MEVIPAIDLLAGRCVRLFKGDFDQVIDYPDDPLTLARRYRDAGMRRLHVVDLDGARSGTPGNAGIISELAHGAGMAVQAGGGIRSFEQAEALLTAGASRVVVGSVAAETPAKALDWIERLGPGRFILAFDVRLSETGEPLVLTRGWVESSGRSLWELVDTFSAAGEIEFLCTDVERDGTLTSPNFDLYRQCCRQFPDVRFIASGGVSSAADLGPLAATGVSAVVTGKALLDGRLRLEEIRQFSLDA